MAKWVVAATQVASLAARMVVAVQAVHMVGGRVVQASAAGLAAVMEDQHKMLSTCCLCRL